MAKEKGECCEGDHHMHKDNGGAAMGGVYGLAFVGAAVYFIIHATTFWIGVLGFLKAIVWPAILMFKILEMLKM